MWGPNLNECVLIRRERDTRTFSLCERRGSSKVWGMGSGGMGGVLWKPGRDVSPEAKFASILIVELWENVYCLSYPVCGLLLRQLEQINTTKYSKYGKCTFNFVRYGRTDFPSAWTILHPHPSCLTWGFQSLCNLVDIRYCRELSFVLILFYVLGFIGSSSQGSCLKLKVSWKYLSEVLSIFGVIHTPFLFSSLFFGLILSQEQCPLQSP